MRIDAERERKVPLYFTENKNLIKIGLSKVMCYIIVNK